MPPPMQTPVVAALLLLTPTTTGLRLPTLRAAPPPPPPPPPPAVASSSLSPLLAACAVGWDALATSVLGVDRARTAVEDNFGLAQTTFEDCVREPAGGLLDLTSVLAQLDVALLFILAVSLDGTAKLELDAKDRARAAAAVGTTAAGVFSTAAIAVASGGVPITTPIAGIAALAATTAVTAGCVATEAVDDPFELCLSDLKALVPFVGGEEEGAAAATGDESNSNSLAANFYRGSTLIGIVVGASFIFSPVSPISIFDTEAPITRMLRQDLGFYVAFVICAAQSSLYRFARDGRLATGRAKALNLLTGLTICLLVNDGLAQVNAGTAALAALDPSDPFVQVVAGGDGFRAETNLDAAYALGQSVGLFYVVQGLRPAREAE